MTGLEELARQALAFAHEAGALLMGGRDGMRDVATKSTPTDVVTDMDRASERLLVERICASWPHDAVLGEEGSERTGSTNRRWVIDPLDGTVNYLYGLPGWSVSVGVEVNGTAAAGAVVAPVLGEAYLAWRAGGAWRVREGRESRMHASAATRLDQALLGTGFSYDAVERRRQGAVVAAVLPIVRDIRRAGSAAIDLCAVANGALDCYAESGLHPWDLCAGGLIAQEAGAIVSGLHGRPAGQDYVVAAAPGLHTALVRMLDALVPSDA